MATARLRKFLVSVPAIVETATAAQAWELFCQHRCEQIAVLNSRGQAIGILRLLRLLSLLPPLAIEQPESCTEAAQHKKPQRNLWQQSLNQLNQKLAIDKPLLEPLILLPLDQRIDQLQPYLPQVDRQFWGLVDASQRFLGLVDRLQLLRFLSLQPGQGAIDRTPRPEAKRESLPRVKSVEQQWQTSGMRQPGTALPAHSLPGTAKPVPIPDPLVELLERLPIPLMLQTASGQVITQNLAWRQQIGELRDPQQVRQEAALVLESADVEARVLVETEAVSDRSAEALPRGDFAAELPSPHWENWNAAASQISTAADLVRLCRVGTSAHDCVCLCPLKSGQERIWQFMKVSMGTASPSAIAPPVADDSFSNAEAAPWQQRRQTDLLPFKLATLSFQPDPNWYWLNQTESLWLVLAQDITEQQQVAKELAAKNADLVQLNRLKDEFLACISHELKTPLTAVLGLSSLLKDQALGSLNDRQARYAQLIHQSGRHLIQIVNNILDLTRIETGQMDLLTEPVAIETVCDRAFEQACQLQMVDEHTDSALPHHPPVRFTLEIQPGLSRLTADELRLRQMLTNLLSNAIKFTPTDGEIGLRVEVWNGWIAFTVWDTGIGIPDEKQHLIFQKFQQLESPMTRRFEGTGLGLVLTQRLARLHGGDVTFRSQEGRGSEFTLLMPPNPPQSQAYLQSASSPQNRLAIVIEADALAVEDLTHQLIGLGYRAAIARSGTEALEKIRRLQPGIIFLNPMLPLLSGWDVLTLLKADPDTQAIPVVMTAMRVQKDLALQNHADDFLNLPIQRSDLQNCLNRLTAATPAAIDRSLPHVTVLYFNPSQGQQPAHLASDLQQQQCRVLEVEDLEQADLLARVWKPNVLLLDRSIVDAAQALRQITQSPYLANLPLITLTIEATEAANRISTLRVFPYLSESWDSPDFSRRTDLLQVIRVAAGMSWTPHVLIVDFSQFNPADPAAMPHRPQAIAQYLQIAGLRSTVALSWAEVLHQLQHSSVNLLLFCVNGDRMPTDLPGMTRALSQLSTKPPILVWHPQSDETPAAYSELATPGCPAQEIARQFAAAGTATEVLPPNLPIAGLLDRVQHILCSFGGSTGA